jgi:hypothetical protein
LHPLANEGLYRLLLTLGVSDIGRKSSEMEVAGCAFLIAEKVAFCLSLRTIFEQTEQFMVWLMGQ